MRAPGKSNSFFADRRLGTKIGAGFAVVLLILAASSAIAWFAFARVGDAVARYSGQVASGDAFQEIDLALTQYAAHVNEYVYSDDEGTAAEALKQQQALRGMVAADSARITDPERRRLLESIGTNVDAFAGNFERLHSMNLDQAKLQSQLLDPVGQKIGDGFTAVIEGSVRLGKPELLLMGAQGRYTATLARLDVEKRLGRHDDAAAQAAEQEFAKLKQVSAQLDAATAGLDLNAAAKGEPALIEQYQKAFERAADLDSEQMKLVNGPMQQASASMRESVSKASGSIAAEQSATETGLQLVLAQSRMLTLALGLGGLALGVVLAWLIGRGISRPVVRMCAAMRALAGGDKTVDIPGVGRNDEIGEMAGTVQVFKDSMNEAERLRAEQESQKVQAAAERRQAMIRLADSFESGVKGIVNAVAAQSTEMQASAQAMTLTAEQATQQATAVAAAVEQASVNVQTVASSAEELSASVLEISRQVNESSTISGQAVSEADRTNAIVEGLNKSAQHIGEVVQLIESIAGQTNLLALNATIEAARAGDAGKGFAVVASEVKSLAGQTAKATEEIKAQITEIQGATGQTVEAIKAIGDTIRRMNEIATMIASAVEQQGAATREIAGNVQQAAQGTGDIANNIGGVSRAANETGAAATQVLGAAGELSKQSETLRHDVEAFLATVRAA